jgi:16S rRNA (cytosine1402-N4)-methyltransferase
MQRDERIDPATRVFQALRIAVNEELDAIAELIDQAVRMIERDGRLVVISYHSLEDRIAKNRLRDLARGQIDQVTGRTLSETRVLELLTRKPVRPTASEIDANPRSRSAKLRAARRL